MKQSRVGGLVNDTRLTKWGAVLLCVPGAVLTALLVAIAAREWYLIGVVADPATIAKYHFGSEAMVGAGGEHYRSAAVYARSALLEALLGLPVLAAFLLALYRRSLRLAVFLYLAIGLAILVRQLV